MLMLGKSLPASAENKNKSTLEIERIKQESSVLKEGDKAAIYRCGSVVCTPESSFLYQINEGCPLVQQKAVLCTEQHRQGVAMD